MNKVRDIQSMFPFMPQVDRGFMESIIGIVPDVESQRTSTETAETAMHCSDAVMTRSQTGIARSNKKTGLMSSLQKNTPENCPDKPTEKNQKNSNESSANPKANSRQLVCRYYEENEKAEKARQAISRS